MTRPKIPNLTPRVGMLPDRVVASAQARKNDDSGSFSHMYAHSRWRKLRLRQLALEPLCRMCSELDDVVRLATICDHVEPHRGDMQKFWNGPFQSLCKPHHDSTKQAQEKSGTAPVVRVGLDGWPLHKVGGE